MPARAKSTLRNACFTLVTLLVCFALLDTAYRLLLRFTRQPGQQVLFAPDPVLGRRHVKGAHALVNEWSQPRPNRVSINAWGFRGPNPQTLEKPPGVIRVIVQGGSTTEDIFVDDGRTWPEQLEAKLKAQLKTDRIEIINMGTSGYTAENCLKDLKLHGLQFQPDIVIAYHGVNDFRKGLQKLNDLEEVEAYAKYEKRQPTLVSQVLSQSCIFDALQRVNYYQGGTRNRAYTLAYWNEPNKVRVQVDGVEEPVLAALDELRELSRQHRFRLILGRQATLMKPELTEEEVPRMWRIFLWKYQGQCIAWDSFLAARTRVVDAQADFARRHGLLYIDTEKDVPKTTDIFVDDAHTMAEGADRISDSFARGLLDAGVFQELLGR